MERLRGMLCCLAAAAGLAPGQALLGGANAGGTIIGADLAVLEARETRKDLPCDVQPMKPVLGFDLRFHAGFDITVPLKELAGSENQLTVLFRVTPEERKDAPAYLIHRFRVPALPDDARGDAYLQGFFDLGEGKYQVDWLMRDRTERVCASNWTAEAALGRGEKPVELAIAAHTAEATETEQFLPEPLALRPAGAPDLLHLKVLVNFAPQNPRSAALLPQDTTALVSILRHLQRDARVGKFTVVAFNVQDQRVVYRHETADRIDFPELGESLKGLRLGRVEFSKLGQKKADTEFLAQLLKEEIGNAPGEDAVIITGPKVLETANVPAEWLREMAEPAAPVFYLNYNLYPAAAPWRDAIGTAVVRRFKGQEYTISRPRDLWFAITEVVGKVVKSKAGRRTASASTQEE